MERQRDFDRSEPARKAESGLGTNVKALDVTLTNEELGELDRTFAVGEQSQVNIEVVFIRGPKGRADARYSHRRS